jgi:ankyrin repeat protein
MLQHGNTAVSWAALRGHLEVLSVLLQTGACIRTPDKVSVHDRAAAGGMPCRGGLQTVGGHHVASIQGMITAAITLHA